MIVFDKCGRDKIPVSTTKITPPKETVKKVEKDELSGNKTNDSLQRIVDSTQRSNKHLKGELKESQAYVEELLQDISNEFDQQNDTNAIQNDYEANTREVIGHLKAANKYKDSVANALIRGQDSVIAKKDYQLSAKDSLYSKLRSNFDYTISQETALISLNKQLTKKVRAKKFGNVVWKVAAIGLGTLFLNEKLK